jgi:threonine dehydrogenase-like Zn-dependent dehydrogenase
MVLGHEPAGVIDKTGTGVTGWSPGDRAVFEPALYCYHCEYCLSGRHNICANIRFLSMPEDPGFLRDYVILPATNILPLDAGLSFAEGSVVEPLAVVLHSMEFAAVRPGETAVVFGAGPIGLLSVACLRLCGASRIWSVGWPRSPAEERGGTVRTGSSRVPVATTASASLLSGYRRTGGCMP